MTTRLSNEFATKEELQDERFTDVQEGLSDSVSEREFHDAALRIVIQRNDFLLPNLIDMLKTRQTLEIAPYYQRRARWDVGRKSRLIESFLVNIPVPPVFLYEREFAQYEVMDGQQRLSAILEYFNNQFELRGLEILNTLHRKRFHELPPEIRAGLERRSLPAIILLKESTPSDESALQLRRYVFQRLNTGGVRLNAQEIRNSVYSGRFNDLLLELSRNDLFTTMWDIPPLEPDEETEPSGKLRRNALFRQMQDAELVLRVFALLDPDNVGSGMRNTLDNSMAKYSEYNGWQLNEMRAEFLRALQLAEAIGGDQAFRLPPGATQRRRPSASLYDGLMVALMRNLDQADHIKRHAEQIYGILNREFENPEFYELVVGRANTRASTLDRARHIERLIESVINPMSAL